MNWAIFSLHFQDAVEAKGFWGHFNGTTPRPDVSKPKDSPAALSTTEAPATAPQTGPSAEELALVAQWEKDERSAKLLLTQKIPDSALIKIRNKLSVKECWDTIVREYTEKGTFAQTKLRARFLEMKCLDKTIDPDTLISLISEESDHQRSQCARRRNGSGKSKGDKKDEALYVIQGLYWPRSSSVQVRAFLGQTWT